MTNSTNKEINEITWTCVKCQYDNTDLLKDTPQTLCGFCGQIFDWQQINIDVSTYFGHEETTVKMSELFFIDKQVADSGITLSKNNIITETFSTLIPEGKIPAYFGSFGEYVPVEFE